MRRAEPVRATYGGILSTFYHQPRCTGKAVTRPMASRMVVVPIQIRAQTTTHGSSLVGPSADQLKPPDSIVYRIWTFLDTCGRAMSSYN